MRILSSLLSSLFTLLCVLFSFRGRVTRAEFLLGTVVWAVAIIVALYTAGLAKTLGYRWAPATFVGFLLVALGSIKFMAIQRVHDVGYSLWSGLWLWRLVRRGMAETNQYGPPPPRSRVLWLFAFLVLAGTAGSAASSLVIERYATAFCTPTVTASAVTSTEARVRWREAVRSKYGDDYLTGISVPHTMTCRNGECIVRGRACRRS